MDIIFGNLQVSGDFTLVDIIEKGPDRDFVIETESYVINLRSDIEGVFRLQFPFIRRILLRGASKEGNELASVHFLSDTDLFSSVCNFDLDVIKYKVEIKNSGSGMDFMLLEK